MHDVKFDCLTRRASLLTLSTAGVAAMGLPMTSDARKKRKKKGDVNVFCKEQLAQCESYVTLYCDTDLECKEQTRACCPLLGTCDFAGFLTCL